jgi:hypothetical protein
LKRFGEARGGSPWTSRQAITGFRFFLVRFADHVISRRLAFDPHLLDALVDFSLDINKSGRPSISKFMFDPFTFHGRE